MRNIDQIMHVSDIACGGISQQHRMPDQLPANNQAESMPFLTEYLLYRYKLTFSFMQ